MAKYIVVKDGEELKSYKTLPAARKLADAENAEVYCDGECVYPAEVTVEKYILTSRMNVRKSPNIKSDRVRIAQKGATVEGVLENDWIHLTDGNYILYDGGKYAEKV